MESASNNSLRGCRVLVAEDDPFITVEIMKILGEAGAQILGPARSLQRALELISTEELDCAVLDIVLRDGFVFPAATILWQRGAGLVFYTGYHDLEGFKRVWPGAQVLLKPASPVLLAEAVKAACFR